jgi:hypothetical protein
MNKLLVWLNTGNPRTVYVKHKTGHALGGILLFLFFAKFGLPKTGVLASLTAGLLKEGYDYSQGGPFRLGDVAWTVLPATMLFFLMR